MKFALEMASVMVAVLLMVAGLYSMKDTDKHLKKMLMNETAQVNLLIADK